ncbi:hypothetical protein [Nonomuraea rhizosphaerae]|uniref:hypothetical protein n=1 Tax=Nonomuraea rhizosphaerae TaxID=2665663 RepID=UPI001FE35BA8|nr:hypothetical protein [Nonomuraea rhizosphaerae]
MDGAPGTDESPAAIFDLTGAGDTEASRAHAEAGVPANLANSKGDTLLMLVAHRDHAATVRMLAGFGADRA